MIIRSYDLMIIVAQEHNAILAQINAVLVQTGLVALRGPTFFVVYNKSPSVGCPRYGGGEVRPLRGRPKKGTRERSPNFW